MFVSNETVLYAIEVATYRHGNQLDKSGRLYLLHPMHVMLQMDTNAERVVAICHDTVEDTDLTLQMLLDTEVFHPDCINAIDAITKRKGEKNEAYWARVRANPLALRVKLADVGHNSSEARLAELDESSRIRLIRKYHQARDFFAEDNGKAFVPFLVGKRFDHAKRILVNAGYDESIVWRLLISNPHFEVDLKNLLFKTKVS